MIITQLSFASSDYAFPCNAILTGAINKELALDYKMLKNPNNRKYDNVNDALSIGQGN